MSPRSPLQLWQERSIDRTMDAQIASVEAYLNNLPEPQDQEAPILFFNASTRVHRVSLNAAYSLLTSWALRARGIPVRYLVCAEGMVQCVLGTRPGNPATGPPCRSCLRVSRRLYPGELTHSFSLDQNIARKVQVELANASIDDLMAFDYLGAPLGELVLPGLRWALRRHQLQDTDDTRMHYRQYLSSAASLMHRFDQVLSQMGPRSIVLFNGIFYPEAVLRYMAAQKGIPVVTHEVGLQPFSAFFSHKEATFREVHIDDLEDLTGDQQAYLDAYLQERFKGKFSMAGVEFWNGLGALPEALLDQLKTFKGIVPIFTNVVFDTSQIHANVLFPDMFIWLDDLEKVITQHPDILFVIRAHPDENRPGKESEQSVTKWIQNSGLLRLKNVHFIGPEQTLSSYELIERSKIVLVYNSSIGLEASILGKPVLCAGRARYTQAETSFFPTNADAYWKTLDRMLAPDSIEVPVNFQRNARKFLYHELFHASLDLSEFLARDPTLQGMVTFKEFEPESLQRSPSLKTIVAGVMTGEAFLLTDTQ